MIQKLRSRKSSPGFTLIELVVVVAIVGILAAIAYPSYMDSVRKSRRDSAQAALVGMAAAMERFFVNNGNSYANAAGGATLPATATFYPSQVPLDGGTATYNLRISVLSATDYTLQAIPTGPQASDKCGTLVLVASGQKTISGGASGMTATDCWRG